MPINLTTSTSPHTSEKIARRQVSEGAVTLSSAGWQKIAPEIRERAFFSANVGEMRILTEMKRRISNALNQVRDSGGIMDGGRFVAEMKEYLASQGYALGGSSVRDITSERRLKLIYEMNVEETKEYARYYNDQNSQIRLNMYPAWEFTRVHPRRVERKNWRERWRAAGGQIYEGRMIALKTSDVWTKLSVFGRPWAPFDFGSGMGCRDVRRAECVRLGLIQKNEKLVGKPVSFNSNLSASAKNIDDETLKEAQYLGFVGKAENGEVLPRPNAYPVSDALEVKIGNKELRTNVQDAIRIINTIHGDGKLPIIPIETGRMKNAYGRFQYYERGPALNIEIRINNSHKRITTIHEIGHFLDIYGASSVPGKSAIENGEMEEIFTAIKNSKKWEEISKNKYYADPAECFARAYAQFIAEESNDLNLKNEFEEMRYKEPMKVWDNDDFGKIKLAIKKFFQEKGWMRL